MTYLRSGGAILLALMLLATACGGGDDAGSDTTTTTATTTTTSTAAAGGDDVPPAGGGDDDGGDLGDLPGALSSNDCIAAAIALTSAFSGGFSPTGVFDPEGVADAFDRMAAVAPDEIEDYLSVMADALGEFFSILQSGNVDLSDPTAFTDPAAQEVLEQAGASLEAAEFEEAADAVNLWFEEQCGGVAE